MKTINRKEVSETLSAGIIQMLRQEGKTLKAIGELMGLSESAISLVNKGKRNLTIDRLQLLEKNLNRPLPKILLQTIDLEAVPPDMQKSYRALKRALVDF